jgi:hypothetical protein
MALRLRFFCVEDLDSTGLALDRVGTRANVAILTERATPSLHVLPMELPADLARFGVYNSSWIGIQLCSGRVRFPLPLKHRELSPTAREGGT